MRKVVKQIPDAKLYVVGDGPKWEKERFISLIAQLKLQNNIILEGFSTDVETYYAKATVLVSTSDNEGYPLVFAEAMSHGIPIVAYDIPWLTFIKDGRGIVTVSRKRIDLMAEKIIELLQNRQEAQEIGLAGKDQIIELSEIDIGAQWGELFASLDEPVPKKVLSDFQVNTAIVHKYTALYHQQLVHDLLSGMQAKQGEIQELNKQIVARDMAIKNYSEAINSLMASISFRLGRKVTFIPRTIRDYLKKATGKGDEN